MLVSHWFWFVFAIPPDSWTKAIFYGGKPFFIGFFCNFIEENKRRKQIILSSPHSSSSRMLCLSTISSGKAFNILSSFYLPFSWVFEINFQYFVIFTFFCFPSWSCVFVVICKLCLWLAYFTSYLLCELWSFFCYLVCVKCSSYFAMPCQQHQWVHVGFKYKFVRKFSCFATTSWFMTFYIIWRTA